MLFLYGCVILHATRRATTTIIGLLALTAVPTVTGVVQGLSAQKRQNTSSKEQEKLQITAMLPMEGELREAAYVILVDRKVGHIVFYS